MKDPKHDTITVADILEMKKKLEAAKIDPTPCPDCGELGYTMIAPGVELSAFDEVPCHACSTKAWQALTDDEIYELGVRIRDGVASVRERTIGFFFVLDNR